MAHPWYHAVMAARKFGGTTEDYLPLETWMDFTKSHIADCRHRLFLHNAWGLFVAERVHGPTLTRASDGKILPLRPLLEDHILQDFGKIPTLGQCLAQLSPEPVDGELGLLEQCQDAVRRFGGDLADYEAVGSFLDWPAGWTLPPHPAQWLGSGAGGRSLRRGVSSPVGQGSGVYFRRRRGAYSGRVRRTDTAPRRVSGGHRDSALDVYPHDARSKLTGAVTTEYE
jgi:hypothetical protein